MRDGTVFIGEEAGERPFEWSGTWSAHWESDDDAEFTDGPQRVSASQAIAWGRARAGVVLIRPGDGVIHSAGASEPKLSSDEPEPLPRWVEGREVDARFACGREYYGRDAQAAPIDWRARLLAGPKADPDRLGELLREAGSTASVVAAPIDADAGGGIDVIVPAATIDAARLLLVEIVTTGLEALDLRGEYPALFEDPVPAERVDPSPPAGDD